MKEPLYRALAAELRREIRSGNLRSGDKLPSKRALAEEKKLSIMTVTGALQLLEAEGCIRAEERRGYFVADGIKIDDSPEPEPESQNTSCRFDFRSSNTAVEGFPFYTWAKLMRETLSEKDVRLLSAIDPKGVRELRTEIARQLRLLRGIACEPRQVIIGAGTEYLIGLLYQLLGKRNYAFESPGYTKAAKIYSHLGANLSFLPTDSQGISVDILRQNADIDVVQVTPSHSFPLGIVTSPERRRELIAWVGEQDGHYIIEDDFDSEFRYSGGSFPSLFSLDHSDRVIYMNTFTRTLAPSMRIGYMVLPPTLLRLFERDFLFYSSTVPALEQYVLARFIADGSFERHLSRMRKIYRRRRDILIEELARFGDHIEVLGVEAGVHILVALKGGLTERGVLDYAASRGIVLAGIGDYLPSEKARGQFGDAVVVNFSGVAEDGIREAASIMYDGFREFMERGQSV